MKKYHVLFEEYLVKNEGRYTSQKKAILEQIIKTKHHFEVEDFIDTLRANDKKFSRATVYRTIKQLMDAQLLQKISTKDGKVYYEPRKEKKLHDHLICNNCGKILEIKEDIIESYLDKFCDNLGFKAEYRSLHIYGTCKQCQKKASAS